MSATTGTDRISRLASVLADEGIDAYFANSPITMGYLHGFWEGSHERFLTLAIRNTGEVRMICPALSENQARRSGIQDIRSWPDGVDPLRHFAELAEDWNLKSAIVAVDDDMPAQMLLKMQNVLPAALFKAGSGTLARLMRAKDAQEIQALKDAADIADKALKAGIRAVKPGATERDVARALNNAMEALGGIPTFCIVAVGPNSAEPHHLTDDTAIKSGDLVLMDFGCSVRGYNSDITRAVSCGHASDEMKKIYDTVLKAHLAGRKAGAVGVAAGDVDAAARKVIEDEGYGEYFIHRTGHGIGLHGHEEPYIIGGSQVKLQPGDAYSVEPGIYLPGKFGVRIENIMVVGESAAFSVNEEPAATLIEV